MSRFDDVIKLKYQQLNEDIPGQQTNPGSIPNTQNPGSAPNTQNTGNTQNTQNQQKQQDQQGQQDPAMIWGNAFKTIPNNLQTAVGIFNKAMQQAPPHAVEIFANLGFDSTKKQFIVPQQNQQQNQQNQQQPAQQTAPGTTPLK